MGATAADTASDQPIIHTIHEPVTGTWQYIVADKQTKQAAIIDSVLDYNKETGVISTTSADHLIELVKKEGYEVRWILETHAHADHLTASRYIQNTLQHAGYPRPSTGIGRRIGTVQRTMGEIYGIPSEELENAFDHTFDDDSTFNIGSLTARVIHLPGHTPDHIGYVIGRNVFTGDSMFNPDVGSARCDFPGGSATELYKSMQKLLSLPEDFKLYTGHDYPPPERKAARTAESAAVPFTTVKEQAEANKHAKKGTKLEEFVQWRTERDSTLPEPKLLKQSMHVNVRGGRLPRSSVDGFKIDNVPARVPVA